MAEALFNKVWGKDHEATSAGTETSGPEQTLESLSSKCQYVIDVLEEEGIDVKNKLRKQFVPSMANGIDKIAGIFDSNNDLDHKSLEEAGNVYDIVWSVPDPKGTDLETHRKVKDKIKELVQGMDL
jgi:protein-tyrosine-phosphatase